MTGPAHSAGWHARWAEELVNLASSASMAGWWRRGRRRELLAQAQVHATLASAGSSVEHLERLAAAEADRDAAQERVDDLRRQLSAVEAALRSYGQDLTADGVSLGEAVDRLMARVFNDEGPVDGPA